MISMDLLSQARVFVVAGPREKFTENEINHLKKYLETGGNILVLLGDGAHGFCCLLSLDLVSDDCFENSGPLLKTRCGR